MRGGTLDQEGSVKNGRQKRATVPGRRRRGWRFVLLGFVALLVIAAMSFAIWWRTFPASPAAVKAAQTAQGVTVSATGDQIAFLPRQAASVGLIFYPGARVDPTAYATYMRGYAEHGYAAFILKVPLNFALLDSNGAAKIIAAHPEIKSWVVGGHSLGGVAASSFAAHTPTVKGLLLYASYPNEDLSQHTSLDVVSIYGTNDGLATPEKVHSASHLLPPSTRYVAIQGGVHAFFGDYGPQDGDGTPTVSREVAHAEIVAASLQLLDRVAQRA